MTADPAIDEPAADHAAPPGSCLQFALLFAPAGQRQGIAILHAFKAHLWTIARSTQEAAVARLKLQWWRDEISRIRSGTPVHPLGRNLADTVRRFHLDGTLLETVFEGAVRELDPAPQHSWDDLDEHCRLSEGALQQLVTQVQAGDASGGPAPAFAEKLGQAMRLAQILRDFREDAAFGRAYIPLEALDARALRVQGLNETPDTSPAVRALLEDLCRRADTRLDALGNELSADEFAAQTPSLVLGGLARGLLKKMRQRNFHFGEDKAALPAMQKLWIAWRTARRAARGTF